ncbi:DUF4126 domain-containing protein [Ancylobacter defluvii]|uniref:Membrane protein n=1 Tax=Ancylobacter defluvii TaxID=1282440 RepID=A0A9W6JXR7_9HYPH|nr:DUF4126 domain-containing protein [Ancylobacter defluvii]MBS7588764.1 DUF4126 domain-containing protein [Ancylobacter defluvii]GLK84050.1 membrane protein [Ancylobacter defluvii]
MLYFLAVLIGVVAGLRAMTAPAAIAWAAHLGWIDVSASPLAFMGYAWTPWIFTALALVEFVTDQLPTTPSRTVPPQFAARLISGALCGACLGVVGGSLLIGAVAGAIGAVIGTLGGRSARGHLAGLFGQDRPAALIEDAVAVIGALIIVMVP